MEDDHSNPWERILAFIRRELEAEEFRRWFSSTSYAGDSGDQINVWIGSEALRRHIETHYQGTLERALLSLKRRDTMIRFIVAGFGDEEEEEEEEKEKKRRL